MLSQDKEKNDLSELISKDKYNYCNISMAVILIYNSNNFKKMSLREIIKEIKKNDYLNVNSIETKLRKANGEKYTRLSNSLFKVMTTKEIFVEDQTDNSYSIKDFHELKEYWKSNSEKMKLSENSKYFIDNVNFDKTLKIKRKRTPKKKKLTTINSVQMKVERKNNKNKNNKKKENKKDIKSINLDENSDEIKENFEDNKNEKENEIKDENKNSKKNINDCEIFAIFESLKNIIPENNSCKFQNLLKILKSISSHINNMIENVENFQNFAQKYNSTYFKNTIETNLKLENNLFHSKELINVTPIKNNDNNLNKLSDITKLTLIIPYIINLEQHEKNCTNIYKELKTFFEENMKLSEKLKENYKHITNKIKNYDINFEKINNIIINDHKKYTNFVKKNTITNIKLEAKNILNKIKKNNEDIDLEKFKNEMFKSYNNAQKSDDNSQINTKDTPAAPPNNDSLNSDKNNTNGILNNKVIIKNNEIANNKNISNTNLILNNNNLLQNNNSGELTSSENNNTTIEISNNSNDNSNYISNNNTNNNNLNQKEEIMKDKKDNKIENNQILNDNSNNNKNYKKKLKNVVFVTKTSNL